MAWKKILLAGDAETEVEAADPLVLAGDVTIVGAGKSLEVINEKLETATTKTLSSDQFTRDQIYHLVAGEGAAADDIDGIGGGADGMLLFIRPSDDAVTITARHNNVGGASGNKLFLSNGADFVMDDETDFLLLVYDAALDSANGAWAEVARGAGGVAVLTSGAPSDVGTTAAVGSSSEASREDHVHGTAAGFIDNANKFAAGVVDKDAIGADAVGNAEIDDSDTAIAFNQIILTPKATGDGTAEGTLFYDSDDDHPYIYQA